MLDDVLLSAATSGSLKLLPSIANELTGGLVDETKAKLLANGSSRLAAAWERERDELLWSIVGAVTAVASALNGTQLTPDQAMDLLVGLAAEPGKRRRLRALFQEASTSADERIAMLAVGYFVGAAETSLQERLDWALRSLFPDDADTLSQIVELSEAVKSGGYLVVQLSNEDENGMGAIHPMIGPGRGGAPHPDYPPRSVRMESIRSLAAARCVEVTPGSAGFGGATIIGPAAGVREAQSLRLLPLGKHLHDNLRAVDWREIAKRRRTT